MNETGVLLSILKGGEQHEFVDHQTGEKVLRQVLPTRYTIWAAKLIENLMQQIEFGRSHEQQLINTIREQADIIEQLKQQTNPTNKQD